MNPINFNCINMRYVSLCDLKDNCEKLVQFWDLGKYCETKEEEFLWLLLEGQRVVVHPIQLISRLRIEAEYVED